MEESTFVDATLRVYRSLREEGHENVSTVVPALAVAALLVAVLVALIGSEHTATRRWRSRGEPSLLQVLEGSHTTLADA